MFLLVWLSGDVIVVVGVAVFFMCRWELVGWLVGWTLRIGVHVVGRWSTGPLSPLPLIPLPCVCALSDSLGLNCLPRSRSVSLTAARLFVVFSHSYS